MEGHDMNQQGQFKQPIQHPIQPPPQTSQYVQTQQTPDTSPIQNSLSSPQTTPMYQQNVIINQQPQKHQQVGSIFALDHPISPLKMRAYRVFKFILYFIGILLSLVFSVMLPNYLFNSGIGGLLGFIVWLGAATGSTFIFFGRGITSPIYLGGCISHWFLAQLLARSLLLRQYSLSYTTLILILSTIR